PDGSPSFIKLSDLETDFRGENENPAVPVGSTSRLCQLSYPRDDLIKPMKVVGPGTVPSLGSSHAHDGHFAGRTQSANSAGSKYRYFDDEIW
ncbi:MAG: hypothetical protein ABSB54_18920, partial [Acidimicrobiales bacterium]